MRIVIGMLCALACATPGYARDAYHAESACRTALQALLEEALGDEAAAMDTSRVGDREIFYEVLRSPAFFSQEVGPFDVFVYRAGGLEKDGVSEEVLSITAAGLEKVVPVFERYFEGREGLVSGRRFPIVIAQSEGDDTFDRVVALLDWCDWTGWKAAPSNKIWDAELRKKETVRTWEPQLFNLAHDVVQGQEGDFFLEHGVGYYTIAHLVADLLRRGSQAVVVPPWLSNGLVDELDIQAYGEAYVGHDKWEKQTPGWFRPGWSGFLPTGHRPPPVVTGPPAELAVTTSKRGNPWDHRENSPERHWDDLAKDRSSKAPASFAFMAESESFMPRDRAYARAMLHMLLDVAPPEGRGTLLELLDREPHTPPSGMPDCPGLPEVVSSALGGVPAVEEVLSRPMGEVLTEAGQEHTVERIRSMGYGELLEIADHREQAEWLYGHTTQEMDSTTRNQLWTYILTAEYYGQLAEWAALGPALDRGADAAFKAAKRYPTKDRDRSKVAQAFWKAVESEEG